MRQCYQWFHGAKRRMNSMRFAKVQPVLFSIFFQWSKIADAIISRNMSESYKSKKMLDSQVFTYTNDTTNQYYRVLFFFFFGKFALGSIWCWNVPLPSSQHFVVVLDRFYEKHSNGCGFLRHWTFRFAFGFCVFVGFLCIRWVFAVTQKKNHDWIHHLDICSSDWLQSKACFFGAFSLFWSNQFDINSLCRVKCDYKSTQMLFCLIFASAVALCSSFTLSHLPLHG